MKNIYCLFLSSFVFANVCFAQGYVSSQYRCYRFDRNYNIYGAPVEDSKCEAGTASDPNDKKCHYFDRNYRTYGAPIDDSQCQ